jgi:MscS family membrane protein
VADFRKATLRFLSRRALVLVLCLAWNASAFPQTALSQIIPGTEAPKEKAPVSTDPLGRATPNGTLFGLLQAVQSDKLDVAAQYLQLSSSKRQTIGPELASQLKQVLDRGFVGSLKAVSTNPEGTAQPGLPSNKERIGTLSVGDSEVDVILAHVDDPEGPGKIWLFSQETLNRIPELYESLQSQEVERHIPTSLVRTQFLGMSAWQWLAMLLGIPLSAGVGWILLQILAIPRRIWERARNLPRNPAISALKDPVWVTLAVIAHGLIVSALRLPLIHRHYYYRASGIVFIAALAWVILRFLTWILEEYRNRKLARGTADTGTLFILSQRVAKTVIVIIAGLAILSVLGLDLTTALAGLGIGGLAIGFGAQKTIENLFGGASVLADEVIRVGDSCNFAGRVGTVEDISFRSTRIRTVERTELSIPNGTLGTMNIENLTRRDKILFNPTLGLRFETTPDQLRYVLAECRRLLYEHPKVETASARVRFAALLESSLSLELFSYVLTKDFAEFTAIREDLLLRIMDIVAQSGTGFAFPSRTLYLGKDSGLNPELTEEAQKKVEAWRKERELPFPDFAQTEISQMRDAITYPDPDSAVNNKKW